MPSTTQLESVQREPVAVSIEHGATLESVISAFHRARAEVAALFSSAGLDPTKTRESARELGINRGLTWRLTRMVRESDPALVASDVPGAQSMTKFFDACRKRGAPETVIDSATTALDRFETALRACTGDRKTLAMLMANRGENNVRSETEKARRKLFEGACGVWGVQTQTRFVTVFVFPSPDDPDMLDAGHVSGFVGCRRLSPRPWPLYYEALHKSTGEVARFTKTPLDPSGTSEGERQLLKPFCSPTVPEINVVEGGGYKRFELASGPIGNEGLTTCVFGTHLRKIYPRYSDPADTAGFLVLLTTPAERVMFDIYVHKDLNISDPPRVQLLDRLMFPHANNEAEFDRQSLPISEPVELLPGGIAGTLCPYIPWYSNLIRDVTGRIGHSIEDFVGSRFQMNFPPVSTTLSRRFDVLPKQA